MMLITNSFTLKISTISLSCLLGVLVVNFLVMLLDKTEKVWFNSITGVFAGIALTFSGFGVGLSPVNSVKDAFLVLGILVTYAVLGLICGYFSILITNKVKSAQQEQSDNNNLENNNSTNENN